jgi:hypothetical protein
MNVEKAEQTKGSSMFENFDTIYLTSEQIQRIAALSLDALVGCQIHTDANDNTVVLVDYVSVDDPTRSEHAAVETDGSWTRTT